MFCMLQLVDMLPVSFSLNSISLGPSLLLFGHTVCQRSRAFVLENFPFSEFG